MVKSIRSDLRSEKKIVITDLSFHDILSLVHLHPSGFVKSYEPRQINNIYYDFLELNNLLDNIQGNSKRLKVRLRWYGSLKGKINASLQFKIKNGTMGEKYDHPIKEILMQSNTTWKLLNHCIRSSLSVEARNIFIFHMEPVVMNTYRRHYFISSDQKYRLTIDRNIKYYNQTNSLKPNFKTYESLDEEIVLEIKYPVDLDKVAHKITSWFPFRISKNSKYVSGVNLTWGCV